MVDHATIDHTGITGVGGAALTAAKYTRSSANYTTTSATFVHVDGTNLALTITTGARRVMIGLVGTISNSGTNTNMFDIDMDAGTKLSGGAAFGLFQVRTPVAGYRTRQLRVPDRCPDRRLAHLQAAVAVQCGHADHVRQQRGGWGGHLLGQGGLLAVLVPLVQVDHGPLGVEVEAVPYTHQAPARCRRTAPNRANAQQGTDCCGPRVNRRMPATEQGKKTNLRMVAPWY